MDALSNREIASLFWLAVLIIFALRDPQVRTSALDVLRALGNWKILTSMLLLTFYTVALVMLAQYIGLWKEALLKDTIYWVVTVGIVLLASVPDALKGPKFWELRKAVALKISVVGAFLINYYVFPLAVELALVPFTAMTLLASAVAHQKGESERVTKAIFDWLAASIGIILAVYGAIRFAGNMDAINWPMFFRSVGLPVWLTLGALPFLYATMVYAGYDAAFISGKIANLGLWERWRTMAVLGTTLHVRARSLDSLRPYHVKQIAQTPSFRAARVRALAITSEKAI